jgi:hypothetical protein
MLPSRPHPHGTPLGLVLVLAIGLAFAGPGPDSVVPHVLAGPDEPGTPLTLVLEVVDARTGAPVPDVEVFLYHADDAGAYGIDDPSDEARARLRVEGRADAAGRFAVRTVLPGDYPDQPPGNRHVHLEYVRAPGYAAWGGVVLFEHDVRADVRTWATQTGFGRVIELVRTDGGWHGVLTLALEPNP